MSMGKTPPPWEPYKAATTSTSIIPPNPDSLIACFKREGLVKYKVSTDLDEFNSSRPGSQFDESDLSSLLDRQQDRAAAFMDARFYTDATFMKLANQLKNRLNNSTSPNTTLQGSSTSTPNKPVNVVGPYIPKKSLNSSGESSSKLQGANTNSSSTSRMMSNQENYERQIQYLEAQLQGMQEQLSIQTQVNQELKKMLVAAIGGEDMQYRLERLVNDKLRFELELANNAKCMDKMTEQIEQISIQCDLWRSKFLASKMMADELSTWKTFLVMLNSQSEKVIRNLLIDNDLMNQKLNTALNILTDYKLGQQNRGAQQQLVKPKSQNNLQLINIILSKLAQLDNGGGDGTKTTRQADLLKEINSPSSVSSPPLRSRTLNELMANEALEQFEWVKMAVNQADMQQQQSEINGLNTLDRLEVLIKQIKQNRNYKFSRLYQPESLNAFDLMLNVCNRCKGDIKTV